MDIPEGYIIAKNYDSLSVPEGETVTLASGSSIIVISGTMTIKSLKGTVIDISTAQEMEGGGQRDGREEGKERNGQKMTVKERRPACTPDRASAQALRPYCQQSQHTRTEDSPGERQRIGESIPLLWSMRNRH